MDLVSPTTRLIAALCRRHDDPGRAEAVAAHRGAMGDREAFLAGVRRHRVHCQALSALKAEPEIPLQVIEALRERVQALRLRGLRQVSELVRVTGLLHDAGIPVAEFKGITLGVLAYGSCDLKESVDLDLLVRPERAAEAVRLLLGNGYRHKYRGTDLRMNQIRAVVGNRKDLALIGPGATKLELHWRLSHGSGLLNGAGERLVWQDVEVAPGQRVATLARPDLVAYLAVHGALHSWARLKWLAEFDALFRAAPPEQRAEWIGYAEGLGAGRCLDFAIAVSEAVIAPFSDAASRARARDFAEGRVTGGILAHALRAIEAPETAPRKSLTGRFASVREDLATKVPLFGRWIDARGLIHHHLFVEKDILRLPLPDRLRYLYPVVRGIFWVGDRLRAGRGGALPAAQG